MATCSTRSSSPQHILAALAPPPVMGPTSGPAQMSPPSDPPASRSSSCDMHSGRCTGKTWQCAQCGMAFCDDCWPKFMPHQPGRVGYDGKPHEKVDPEVKARLTRLFTDPSQTEHDERHGEDIGTTWFGLSKSENQSYLHHSNLLAEVLQDSHLEDGTERFPQLVSFVGQTGAGKSTVIEMLIDRERARKGNTYDGHGDYPGPVPGLTDANIPTTGDVHLYADPGSYYETRPILYADCEGMTGGEHSPRGLVCREKLENAKKHGAQAIKNKLQKRWKLAWALSPRKQSREFAVTTLFPKILYTFSDVVVFVLREAKQFETEVLKKLVRWAAMSFDKSVNQPSLPHIVIVLNATDTAIAETQWDPAEATRRLMNDNRDSVHRVHELRQIVAKLEATGKRIDTTQDLLEYYYSSVTVLRIPGKGRYMQMDEQVRKLYQLIGDKCAASHAQKQKTRMLLSADRLSQYVNAAFHHFSQELDRPFDFVEEARRHTPLPKDFGGHILNLILSTYNHQDDDGGAAEEPEELLMRMSRPIASCLMLAAMKDKTIGTYSNLLYTTYYESLREAFDEFCNHWMRCSYSENGRYCSNVRSSHRKGHQDALTGDIFRKGAYQSDFNDDRLFKYWIENIDQKIADLNKQLGRQAIASDERIVMPTMHRKVMEHFYCFGGPARSVTQLKSNVTCLCCVRKVPEVVLPCGHVLCKDCVQTFGAEIKTSSFELDSCPSHPQKTRWQYPMRVQFKPKEAGVRVMCLDGGGVRGLVELILLEKIERELGGHIPVQNFFDQIVGTSTGGIIALAIGVKGGSVSKTIVLFKDLCRDAFTPRAARIFRFFSALRHKSYYRTKPLEEALQEAFDDDSTLFGGHGSEISSTIRVAVTSTTTAGNLPVIMSNYNTGINERDTLPYEFIRPQDPNTKIKIWEAARATAAAPLYFKPFTQSTGATYTDGAIHHNCPALVADDERRLLWGDVSDLPPDIFLSVGTGRASESKWPSRGKAKWSPPPGHKQKAFGLRFIYRAAHDIIDNQLNCEKIWAKHLGRALPAGRTHRDEDRRRHVHLNVEFPRERPRLDKVEELAWIEAVARRDVSEEDAITEVAHRLVASCFFFEKTRAYLNTRPGGYSCDGFIRCRFDEGSNDLKGLGHILRGLTRGKTSQPTFLLQENFGSRADEESHNIEIPLETIADMCRRGVFALRPLTIDAANLASVTRLSLRLQLDDYLVRNPGSGNHYVEPWLSISGFPRQLCSQDTVLSPDTSPGPGQRRKLLAWGRAISF